MLKLIKMNEIKIGNQIWMSENLDVDTFSNGDSIPEVNLTEEWMLAGTQKQPACRHYSDQISSRGRMYNWYALNDPRGLAVEGWRVPTEADWEELIVFVGGKDIGGKKLKSNSGEWEDFGGDNAFGMNILPGGFMGPLGLGQFRWFSHFWTATDGEELEKDFALSFVFDGLSNEARTSFCPKSYGKYARLIKITNTNK
jgi:uncharacterized protein (TIGR02145 family)